MKKILISFIIYFSCSNVKAQSFEVQQLLLNVEKLAQFKQILADLKKGYEIISKGYTTIRNISQGNFSLHDVFLDALLQVSPTVRNYKKISDVVSIQIQLVKEYKSAWRRFQTNNNFSAKELDHIEKTYSNLFKASLTNLDDLFMVITARQLRMSDDERLTAIDKIHDSMQDKIVFLRHFNNSTSILGIQRAKEKNDVDVMRKLYDLPN